MKKRIVGAIVALLLMASCTQKKNYIVNDGFAQGTTYHIVYESTTNFQSEIDSLLDAFNKSLSIYDSTSIISRINRNEQEIALDDWFVRVFNKSKEVYQVTNGFFDITVGPLVNAYGFGYTNKSEISDELIDSLLSFVGMSKVAIVNNELIKQEPGVIIDVNAIAQGFSVDLIAEFLASKKVDNYLIELGGEIITKGVNAEGNVWKVGLDKPVENNFTPGANLQEIITLENKALATSGNYRKFYEKDGVKYTHSINPKTGKSTMQSILSATIIANDCMSADAYATACMVIGLEEAGELIRSIPQMEAYFVYSDEEGNYQVEMTEGMKQYIKK